MRPASYSDNLEGWDYRPRPVPTFSPRNKKVLEKVGFTLPKQWRHSSGLGSAEQDRLVTVLSFLLQQPSDQDPEWQPWKEGSSLRARSFGDRGLLGTENGCASFSPRFTSRLCINMLCKFAWIVLVSLSLNYIF